MNDKSQGSLCCIPLIDSCKQSWLVKHRPIRVCFEVQSSK